MLWRRTGGLARAFSIAGTLLGAVVANGGISPVLAGDRVASNNHVPRLADLMTTMQMRHIKLWFSGRAGNWPLAEYEMEQMLANFEDIALLYPGIPAADMASLMQPINEIKSAIAARNVSDFSKAFGSMTAVCNACHQEIGKGYIVIQVPTASPFSNQAFPPR